MTNTTDENVLICKNSALEWLESKAVANDGVAPLVRIPDAIEYGERIRAQTPGICKDISNNFSVFECSECFETWKYKDGAVRPAYCPSCGRMVE